MLNTLRKIDLWYEKVCLAILVVGVALMLVLSLFNIVSRWWGQSFLWIDPLVRHLVFLGAFLGGAIATGKKNHIAVDIVAKFLEAQNQPRLLMRLQGVIALVSLGCVLGLAYASYSFMLQEREYGAEAFLGIHSSWLVGIMPLGFCIIGLRYVYQICEGFLGRPQAIEGH